MSPVPLTSRLIHGGLLGADRNMPRNRQAFELRHHREQYDDNGDQYEQRGPHQRAVERPSRGQQQVTEPLVRSDELANDRPDNRQTYGDLKSCEHLRKRRRSPHSEHDLQGPGAHRTHEVDHIALDAFEPDDGRHDDGEEGDQEYDRDFRQNAEAKPNRPGSERSRPSESSATSPGMAL